MATVFQNINNLRENLLIGLLTVVSNSDLNIWLKATFSQCREYKPNQRTPTPKTSCWSFTCDLEQRTPALTFWTELSIQLFVFDDPYTHAH